MAYNRKYSKFTRFKDRYDAGRQILLPLEDLLFNTYLIFDNLCRFVSELFLAITCLPNMATPPSTENEKVSWFAHLASDESQDESLNNHSRHQNVREAAPYTSLEHAKFAITYAIAAVESLVHLAVKPAYEAVMFVVRGAITLGCKYCKCDSPDLDNDLTGARGTSFDLPSPSVG